MKIVTVFLFRRKIGMFRVFLSKETFSTLIRLDPEKKVKCSQRATRHVFTKKFFIITNEMDLHKQDNVHLHLGGLASALFNLSQI